MFTKLAMSFAALLFTRLIIGIGFINAVLRHVLNRMKPKQKIFLGQYVGKFKTEHNRQDLSTGYMLKIAPTQLIKLNHNHFSDYLIAKKPPSPMGAMYRFYIKEYLKKGANPRKPGKK